MDFIFHFGKDIAAENYAPDILGNKGANLAKMASLGFNVPPGFIISSKLCEYYYANNKTLPVNFDNELKAAIAGLEKQSDKVFGEINNPLLLSVRSGATVSMPGMMETILNVGLNDQTAQTLERRAGENFALDSYRRFLKTYGTCVLHIPPYLFDQHIKDLDFKNLSKDEKLAVVDKFKKTVGVDEVEKLSDVYFQLKSSILTVLNSWTFEKAVTYRKIYNIPDNLGTAIVVQAMVFGNTNDYSGTGVVFSRNPVNGNNKLYGEFLLNAQGEDVVAGEYTPVSIDELDNPDGLLKRLPQSYDDLVKVVAGLEQHFRDMQDIEFTIEDNKLYILQTRSGKRSSLSSIKIAVDMALEGIITRQEAIKRVDPESLKQLMHLFVDYSKSVKVISKGLPASPGSACGIVAFTSDDAERISSHSSVILVRQDTSPEDIKGMHHSSGILTSRGGMTSHAAVVARGMGKPCISGAPIKIDLENRVVKIGDFVIGENDYITIDGSSGNIILGKTELVAQKLPKEFDVFMQWVDEVRTMKVRANAENVLDIQAAIKFGAEGIGLCRTEHMLFEKDRLNLIRKIVIESSLEKKRQFIDELFVLHKQDFKDIFSLSQGLPVNIRLLDPPLHEFLPFEDFENIAKALHVDPVELEQKIQNIAEKNPMLGHRGCRLGVTLPELYQMQVRAIFEAAIEVRDEKIYLLI
jgi:pyruvate,orthophosphate dikinase